MLLEEGVCQIPYDYTLEVRNRFKGLDLTDRVAEDLRMEVYDIVQDHIQEKERQNGCLRSPCK